MSDLTIDRSKLPIRRPPFGGATERTLAESAPEVDQILRADVLVAEDKQFVIGQRILNGVLHFIGYRIAKIDAGDLRAEVGTDPRHRDTGMLRDDGTAPETLDGLVHDAILP